MIRFNDVTKRYGEKTAVSRLNMTVENGSVCVLIGPSGCGKSTTLKMINRLLEPDDGTLEVADVPLRDWDPVALRLEIGYVIQSVGLLPHMRVWQNISLVPRLLGWSRLRRRERAEELLELVGLNPAEYRDKHPSQLSGGEAQRVGVARALAADPPYLLMDEPFGAVDPLTRSSLQQSFRQIQSRLKKTVVLVTHDLDEAIFLADRIALLRDGELHQFGSPGDLLARPADPFVAEFVGSDRMLRILNTVELTQVNGSRRGDGAKPTLRDALAQLLSSEKETIEVAFGNGESKELDFAGIREMVRS